MAKARSAWHPRAIRIVYSAAGAFINGRPKLVWHTTEGFGLPRYNGSAPHFTFNPESGQLWQHVPVTLAAKALLHPTGTPHTNFAHAIQVELIGFAARTQEWTTAAYARIASLARWIETNTSVPRKTTVLFGVPAHRIGGSEFVSYSGHIGHEHVPNNTHWDPGRFRIDLVLDQEGTTATVPRTRRTYPFPGVLLRATIKGHGARRVQRWINRLHERLPSIYQKVKVDNVYGVQTAAQVKKFQRRHDLPADGVVGPITWEALRKEIRHGR